MDSVKLWEQNLKKQWYAVFVVGGKEEQVKTRLEHILKDKKFYIPKRELRERKNGEWHFVKRKLFPGYVLIKGRISIDDYYKLSKVNNVIRLLKDENSPLTIYEREVKILEELTNNLQNDITISTIVKQSDCIKVVEGPLVGLEGLITKVNKRKGRAKVKLNFLGEERIIELGVNTIEKNQ